MLSLLVLSTTIQVHTVSLAKDAYLNFHIAPHAVELNSHHHEGRGQGETHSAELSVTSCNAPLHEECYGWRMRAYQVNLVPGTARRAKLTVSLVLCTARRAKLTAGDASAKSAQPAWRLGRCAESEAEVAESQREERTTSQRR